MYKIDVAILGPLLDVPPGPLRPVVLVLVITEQIRRFINKICFLIINWRILKDITYNGCNGPKRDNLLSSFVTPETLRCITLLLFFLLIN